MIERKCRKCSGQIPWRIVVDGKVKFLPNRKYCLECSPWGFHNTKKDINKPNYEKKPYGEWTEEQKKKAMASHSGRALNRKLQLINMAGGGCKICGYNKSSNALSFHHKRDKLFQLNLTNLASKSWELILAEFDKCDLLCMNCHAEIS